MIFNTSIFLLFFSIFFIAYWQIAQKGSIKIRNLFIILGSYFFYGCWDWRFLSLIIISSLADYIIGLSIDKSSNRVNRRILLGSSLMINLGILGFFKYFNFFVDSASEILSLVGLTSSVSTLNIILPIGISFYTFQTLSYTIDIYQRKLKPTRDIISFFAFVSFFPQLVAGPIERASRLLHQFHDKKVFNYDMCVIGLRLMLWGMFKKVVIADNLGVLVDVMFASNQDVNGLVTIVGTIMFGLQIYCDFSGYSDIAIGVAKTLGFDLMKNFQTPYFASSFSSFWHRWHISLSTWFRDYVYIPLGGNRSSSIRISVNIMVTFLLSGLWHGANVTFLLWGGLHGMLLIAEKWWNQKVSIKKYTPLVFVVVMMLWLPFRAQNMDHLITLSSSIIQFQSYSLNDLVSYFTNYTMFYLIAFSLVILCFGLVEYQLRFKDFNEWIFKKRKPIRIACYSLLLFTILLLGNFDVKPQFIYFQF